MAKRICYALLMATVFFLAAMVSLWRVQPVSQAQSSGIAMTKVLNKASNVVRVGEVLSFTIALTNESAFTLTGVTLVDNYDNAVLAFASAMPPQDGHDAGTAVITWSNVAVPPLPPGQSVSVTVVFTAEHPKSEVVNFARAQDIIHSTGSLSFTAETSQTQEALGGSAPVFKTLWPTGTLPLAGLPVTFTHLITNDGAAFLTYLPLTDTYDAVFLEYHLAIPTPTTISPPGLLVWDNLASPAYFGPITPFQTIVVTTVFTATTDVITTINQASTRGARDAYDNDLAAGEAQAPITILPAPSGTPTLEPTPAPTLTPTATPTKKPKPSSDDRPAPPSTPVPAPTATPTTTPTNIPFPTTLPETGQGQAPALILLGLGSGALALGWYSLRGKKRMASPKK
jgi:uncharacterized repeat protein (TIGR01451 family)/LPXTG-motif cell wall-anchored protein